jgi:hypothetical protein
VIRALPLMLFLLVLLAGIARADSIDRDERTVAGSVQLDYMLIPKEKVGRDIALDGATAEASLKIVHDFGDHLSGSLKVCVACHGLEVGMAYFDFRVSDELGIRVGRFTPQFGSFPIRHDPANHRTSDKPLPYDMGRMLRLTEWNLGILPSPWVDNGVEVSGAHAVTERVQIDYAAYAITGPRAGNDPADFDFKLSRSGESYYVDNNSEPTLGAHFTVRLARGAQSLTAGLSTMLGHYDPRAELGFVIAAAHLVLQLARVTLRAEYLARRTEMALGTNPANRFQFGPRADGTFDPDVLKEGWYAEAEVPITSGIDAIARWDGLRRRGNVLRTSELLSDSALVRYTIGGSMRVHKGTRLKVSGELYDFSDFSDRVVFHVAIAGVL